MPADNIIAQLTPEELEQFAQLVELTAVKDTVSQMLGCLEIRQEREEAHNRLAHCENALSVAVQQSSPLLQQVYAQWLTLHV